MLKNCWKMLRWLHLNTPLCFSCTSFSVTCFIVYFEICSQIGKYVMKNMRFVNFGPGNLWHCVKMMRKEYKSCPFLLGIIFKHSVNALKIARTRILSCDVLWRSLVTLNDRESHALPLGENVPHRWLTTISILIILLCTASFWEKKNIWIKLF